MQFLKSLGLFELEERELDHVSGASMPADAPGFQVPGRGGEVHGGFSGPPMRGEFGGSFTGAGGARIGGSVSSDGRDWMAGVSGAMTSASGRTTLSGSAYTNGHDWGVTGMVVHRF